MLCAVDLTLQAACHQQSNAKMATHLEACTKEEQRSVFIFLGNKGMKPIKIHRYIELQYGNMFITAVGV